MAFILYILYRWQGLKKRSIPFLTTEEKSSSLPGNYYTNFKIQLWEGGFAVFYASKDLILYTNFYIYVGYEPTGRGWLCGHLRGKRCRLRQNFCPQKIFRKA